MRTGFILIAFSALVSYILSQGIVIGGDHDIIANKIVNLTNMLREKSVEELRDYCIKVQLWRSEAKKEMFIGKFEDIAVKFDKDSAMKYIVISGLRYKELLDMDLFKKIIAPKKQLEFLSEIEEEHEHEGEMIVGGLEDFIWRMDRPTLENWALSCEKYVNEKKGKKHILGGLHDSLRYMTNQQVSEYIMDRARDYNELNSAQMLTKLSTQYGFVQPPQ